MLEILDSAAVFWCVCGQEWKVTCSIKAACGANGKLLVADDIKGAIAPTSCPLQPPAKRCAKVTQVVDTLAVPFEVEGKSAVSASVQAFTDNGILITAAAGGSAISYAPPGPMRSDAFSENDATAAVSDPASDKLVVWLRPSTTQADRLCAGGFVRTSNPERSKCKWTLRAKAQGSDQDLKQGFFTISKDGVLESDEIPIQRDWFRGGHSQVYLAAEASGAEADTGPIELFVASEIRWCSSTGELLLLSDEAQKPLADEEGTCRSALSEHYKIDQQGADSKDISAMREMANSHFVDTLGAGASRDPIELEEIYGLRGKEVTRTYIRKAKVRRSNKAHSRRGHWRRTRMRDLGPGDGRTDLLDLISLNAGVGGRVIELLPENYQDIWSRLRREIEADLSLLDAHHRGEIFGIPTDVGWFRYAATYGGKVKFTPRNGVLKLAADTHLTLQIQQSNQVLCDMVWPSNAGRDMAWGLGKYRVKLGLCWESGAGAELLLAAGLAFNKNQFFRGRPKRPKVDDQQHGEIGFDIFTGATIGARGTADFEWCEPESHQFESLLALEGAAAAHAGIGAAKEFELAWDGRRFMFRVRARIVFGSGASGSLKAVLDFSTGSRFVANFAYRLALATNFALEYVGDLYLDAYEEVIEYRNAAAATLESLKRHVGKWWGAVSIWLDQWSVEGLPMALEREGRDAGTTAASPLPFVRYLMPSAKGDLLALVLAGANAGQTVDWPRAIWGILKWTQTRTEEAQIMAFTAAISSGNRPKNRAVVRAVLGENLIANKRQGRNLIIDALTDAGIVNAREQYYAWLLQLKPGSNSVQKGSTGSRPAQIRPHQYPFSASVGPVLGPLS